MEQVALPLLKEWESFYVIVGPSAAALTGLQFVVIVLSAEMNFLGSSRTVSVFSTPTIVHFCAALLISAVLSAPWPSLAGAAAVLGVCGVAGLAYVAVVVRNVRRHTDYEPVLEDWIWHCALPLVAYLALLVAATMLPSSSVTALFTIGGIAILLLFIGIHNAWDSVVYIALSRRQQPESQADRDARSDEPDQPPEN
jgi:hypothetical protein